MRPLTSPTMPLISVKYHLAAERHLKDKNMCVYILYSGPVVKRFKLMKVGILCSECGIFPKSKICSAVSEVT